MADVEIQVDDDAVVDVEVDPTTAAALDEQQGKVKAGEGGEDAGQQEAVAPNAAEEAAARLTKANQETEDARRAQRNAEASRDAERARADEATRIAQRSGEEARTAREAAHKTSLDRVTSEITTYQGVIEGATADYATAMEAGDFKKAAESSRRMAEAASDLSVAKQDKRRLEEAASEPVRTHEGRVEAIEPAESYIRNNIVGATSQAWLRNHRDCLPPQVGGDATKHSKMMQGHYAAASQGLQPGTPDYFRVIEETIGLRSPTSSAADTKAAEGTVVTPKPAQRKAAPAAPPSRDVPSSDGSTTSSRSVRLTPAEQEAALFSYPQDRGEKDDTWRKRAFGTYAREKVSAQAEGKIGRMTH